MIRHYVLPRLRTLLILGGVLLFCTFYWDIIILYRLYSPLHTLQPPANRKNKWVDWSWECVAGESETRVCRRVKVDSLLRSSMCLATCNMICSPGRHIWPMPTGDIRISNTTTSFQTHLFEVNFKPMERVDLEELLKKTVMVYKERISNLSLKSHTQMKPTRFTVEIDINKSSRGNKYKLNIDESYRLTVVQKKSQVLATIKASNFLGARHALETLVQLVWWDERDQVLKVFNSVVITDAPIFSYRGLMLDTASNFIPLNSILRTIDAMSFNKLNVFHWHLTDSKSFPFDSHKFSHFKTFGPYSSNKMYSPEDIKHVVEYAETRGVAVLMEVDAPAHIGQGWDWGVKEGMGNLSLCLNAQPFAEFCSEPPCGQLNPANNNSYHILVQIIKELYSITKTDNMIHIGGNDIDYMCWEGFEEVTDMDKYMNKGIFGVWELFYEKFFDELKTEKFLSQNVIMWSNRLLDVSKVWKHFRNGLPIIQSRSPSSSGDLVRVVKNKFRAIVSSSDVWDLSDPQQWLPVYKHRPWQELSLAEKKLIVGGEALAWTEHLDHHTMEPGLWPIASAVAERLWSDPAPGLAPTDRLAWFRERMLEEGIACSPVAPRWCLQNPNECQ